MVPAAHDPLPSPKAVVRTFSTDCRPEAAHLEMDLDPLPQGAGGEASPILPGGWPSEVCACVLGLCVLSWVASGNLVNEIKAEV